MDNVSVYTDQFSVFEWIRKNKKHKNKSIGFLFKFAKINWRKNIQIYGIKDTKSDRYFLFYYSKSTSNDALKFINTTAP